MNYNYDTLRRIESIVGPSYYLLNSAQFRRNCIELTNSFRIYYPDIYIAYSYKTNYIPKLCRIVDEIGGYAEVVSEMELAVAKSVGVKPERIIFNGPYKNMECAKQVLFEGGCVNADSLPELVELIRFATEHSNVQIHLGIRCNYDIHDGSVSRFGIDSESYEFEKALELMSNTKNVVFEELHFHYAPRSLATWKERMHGLELLFKKHPKMKPAHVDVGGGIYGKMAPSLKAQFDCEIPSYEDYARVVAKQFANMFQSTGYKPKLFIEPGSAVSGDCMDFVAKVTGLKTVRGKTIATVLGSMYNINPTLNKKNPPIQIVQKPDSNGTHLNDGEFGGYTCIESDYIYRHYSGRVSVGDYAVFGNAGSYSVVLKPPFILPNFAIVDISNISQIEVVKRAESFEDLFNTYYF